MMRGLEVGEGLKASLKEKGLKVTMEGKDETDG
jgi:hypothetical protein